MLYVLSLAFTILLILVNLTGLSLAGARVVRDYALSRVLTVPALALVLFFFEHFVGLGELAFVWPLSTAASLWLIATRRDTLREHRAVEVTFLLTFLWVLAWRVAFPGISGSSEKVGDLAMIVSHLPGDRLPPPDAWYPPYRFDIYYAFQHYAAALLGRVFALGPGLTYNLAFCVVVALTSTAAALFVRLVSGGGVRSALVVLAFVVGGTGATLPVHAMLKGPQLHSGMRFIGGSAMPERVETDFGHAVLRVARVTTEHSVELPSETFAYLVSLGDYHPQLSGFYLLALALLCVAVAERHPDARARQLAQAVFAATPVLCLISDGWTMPLQGALVVTWGLYRLSVRRPPDWTACAAGVFVATCLAHPFLLGFTANAVHQAMRPRPVPLNEHAPLLLGLILLYPIIVAALLPLMFGERRREVVWTSLFWITLLSISESFFIDDIYSGPFNRFNTTLKWWPWIQAGALLTLGAAGVRASSKVVRYGTIVVLLAVTSYGVDLVRVLVRTPKHELGRLDGGAWIERDAVERAIMEFLDAQPRGIVLQRPEAGAFRNAPVLALLTGQQVFLGWSEHEKLWRGQRMDVDLRARAVASFYRGELPDSLRWLQQNRIDHVLWLKTEIDMPAGAFDRIDEQIRADYTWQEYYRAGEFRVGVWSRMPQR